MSFIEVTRNGVTYMTAPNIMAAHAFTTRFEGVSQGIYSSLNLGINRGDDPELVMENYRRVCGVLGITIDDLVCSHQIHSANIRPVTRADRAGLFKSSPHKADGLITCDAGVALLVFTADCVPILLHDPVSGVIAAVHAGWRGTARDIAGAAVRKMVKEFGCVPVDISAAIGPCISGCCFETSRDVVDALYEALGTLAERCVSTFGDKFMVDLKEANRLLLGRAGLVDIVLSDECTCCQSEKYWSHRRTNGHRGSQAAIIVKGSIT